MRVLFCGSVQSCLFLRVCEFVFSDGPHAGEDIRGVFLTEKKRRSRAISIAFAFVNSPVPPCVGSRHGGQSCLMLSCVEIVWFWNIPKAT